jgi:TATA-binding protein-associated factor Taf7
MKKNIGDIINELEEQELINKDKMSVAYNPKLSNVTRMNLKKLISKCKKVRRELWR